MVREIVALLEEGRHEDAGDDRMRGMERYLKVYIFSIVFFAATSGYAVELVPPENNNSSAVAEEAAREQWADMRQQPELTEASGTKSALRQLVESKPRVPLKSATPKNTKSVNKKETADGADKAKSPDGTAKTKKPDATGKTKNLGVADKARSPEAAGKAKSSADGAKAKSPDGTTKTEY